MKTVWGDCSAYQEGRPAVVRWLAAAGDSIAAEWSSFDSSARVIEKNLLRTMICFFLEI